MVLVAVVVYPPAGRTGVWLKRVALLVVQTSRRSNSWGPVDRVNVLLTLCDLGCMCCPCRFESHHNFLALCREPGDGYDLTS